MADKLEATATKSSHIATIANSQAGILGIIGTAIIGAASVLGGYLTLPNDVKKLQEEVQMLREKIVAQQVKIDSGLRGPQSPQGERGPMGPQGERGTPGQKGEASTQHAGLTREQIVQIINSEFSKIRPSSSNLLVPMVPARKTINAESDGCIILPPRQISMQFSVRSGSIFCTENRSAKTEIFGIEASRKRIHLQTSDIQWTCELSQSQCVFNWNNEYRFRIDSFSSDGLSAILVFFRP